MRGEYFPTTFRDPFPGGGTRVRNVDDPPKQTVEKKSRVERERYRREIEAERKRLMKQRGDSNTEEGDLEDTAE